MDDLIGVYVRMCGDDWVVLEESNRIRTLSIMIESSIDGARGDSFVFLRCTLRIIATGTFNYQAISLFYFYHVWLLHFILGFNIPRERMVE